MPNGKKEKPVAQEQIAPEPVAAEQPAPEPTKDELLAQLKSAFDSGDYKQIAQVSRKIDQRERADEKAELEAKRAALQAVEDDVKAAITDAITPLVASGKLDAADGIWFSYDFGDQQPSIRLTKTAARTPRAGGGGTGKKFDVSTDSLLQKYGEEQYKDTGMTIKAAYDSNTDKNWRYAIRQYLLKKDGII